MKEITLNNIYGKRTVNCLEIPYCAWPEMASVHFPDYCEKLTNNAGHLSTGVKKGVLAYLHQLFCNPEAFGIFIQNDTAFLKGVF